MWLEIEKKMREKASKLYSNNKKNFAMAIRIVIVMFFSIAIGVNCLYIEDYILLMFYVVGIGIIVFFVPLEKIKKFLGIDD